MAGPRNLDQEIERREKEKRDKANAELDSYVRLLEESENMRGYITKNMNPFRKRLLAHPSFYPDPKMTTTTAEKIVGALTQQALRLDKNFDPRQGKGDARVFMLRHSQLSPAPRDGKAEDKLSWSDDPRKPGTHHMVTLTMGSFHPPDSPLHIETQRYLINNDGIFRAKLKPFEPKFSLIELRQGEKLDHAHIVNAQKNEIPILIKRGDQFSIYGLVNNQWKESNVHFEEKHKDYKAALESLSFNNKEMEWNQFPHKAKSVLVPYHQQSINSAHLFSLGEKVCNTIDELTKKELDAYNTYAIVSEAYLRRLPKGIPVPDFNKQGTRLTVKEKITNADGKEMEVARHFGLMTGEKIDKLLEHSKATLLLADPKEETSIKPTGPGPTLFSRPVISDNRNQSPPEDAPTPPRGPTRGGTPGE